MTIQVSNLEVAHIHSVSARTNTAPLNYKGTKCPEGERIRIFGKAPETTTGVDQCCYTNGGRGMRTEKSPAYTILPVKEKEIEAPREK